MDNRILLSDRAYHTPVDVSFGRILLCPADAASAHRQLMALITEVVFFCYKLNLCPLVKNGGLAIPIFPLLIFIKKK